MSTNSLRLVGQLKPIWTPADGKQTAEDAAKHKPVRLREWAFAPLLIFLGIVLPGLAAPSAQASPTSDAVAKYGTSVVCATLDENPGADGVTDALVYLLKRGYTTGEAADIVTNSVLALCDEHTPDLQAFIDKYAPTPAQAKQTAAWVTR